MRASLADLTFSLGGVDQQPSNPRTVAAFVAPLLKNRGNLRPCPSNIQNDCGKGDDAQAVAMARLLLLRFIVIGSALSGSRSASLMRGTPSAPEPPPPLNDASSTTTEPMRIVERNVAIMQGRG